MPIFPLPFVPHENWCGERRAHRYFGAPRPVGAPRPTRLHAGCDLIAPEGTEVFAVDSGEVRYVGDFPMGKEYPSSLHVMQIVIRQPFFTARYCELNG